MKAHEHKYISGQIGDECEFCGLMKTTIDRIEEKVGGTTHNMTKIQEITSLSQVEELVSKYGKKYEIKAKPENYIHEGLNSAEFLSHLKKDITEALIIAEQRGAERVRKLIEKELRDLDETFMAIYPPSTDSKIIQDIIDNILKIKFCAYRN